MAQATRGSVGGIITLSPSAIRDLTAIYNYTAEQWNEQQADDYAAFLDAKIKQLANNPAVAPLVPGEPNTRCYVARWNNTRQGHRIFFEEFETGILILRILHTAMNWPDIVR